MSSARLGPRPWPIGDGLIWAASMVVLDASRRNRPVPRLAAWSFGPGIVATGGANLAHGIGHGRIGASVSAWPALALAAIGPPWPSVCIFFVTPALRRGELNTRSSPRL